MTVPCVPGLQHPTGERPHGLLWNLPQNCRFPRGSPPPVQVRLDLAASALWWVSHGLFRSLAVT